MPSDSIDTSAPMPADERLALLTRIAVELTFLVPELDEEFGEILTDLRKSIGKDKNGVTLKKRAATFFEYLVKGEFSRAEANQAEVKDSVAALVAALDAGFPEVYELFELKEGLASATSLDEVAGALHQLIPLVGKLKAPADSAPGANRPGREGRAGRDASKGSSWLSRLAGRGGTLEAKDAFALVRDAIGPVLERVLEQIQMLDMQPDRSQAIKADLNAALSLEDFQAVFEKTLQLVIDIAVEIDGERGHTENFLGELRLHLNTLEEGIASAIDIEASLLNADRIQAELGDQVSGIEAAVTDSDNLSLLKQVVSKRVGVLTRSVTDYIENEREQAGQARERVVELTRQVQSMDAEIETLRTEVSEKQAAINTDALTGVANRGGFDKRIVEEVAHSRRIKYPLSLLFVDVDKFKTVNDTFGHEAGDNVLRAVADAMKSRVRQTDYIARYGGDEFVVLLPDTPADEAKRLAEELLDNVRDSGFHDRGEPVEITLSIGVTEVKAQDTVVTALKRADDALRHVKNVGRNAVEIAA